MTVDFKAKPAIVVEQRTNAMNLRSHRKLPTREGCNSNPKDPSNDSDQNTQCCSRIGCSGRIRNISQNVNTGRLNKASSSKSGNEVVANSKSGNEVVANSPRSSLMTKSRRLNLDNRRELSSQLALDSSGTQKLVSPPRRRSTRNLSTSVNKLNEAAMAENGSSSALSDVASGKRSRDKLGPNRQNAQPTPLVTSLSKSSGMGTLDRSNKTKYFLRNLKCNLISDVVRPIRSSTKSESSGKVAARKRSPEGDSGSDRRVRRSNAAALVQKNVSALKKKDSSQNNSSVASSVRTSGATNLNHGRNSSSSRVPDSVRRIDAARTSSSPQCSISVAVGQSITVSSPPGERCLIPMNVGSQQRINEDRVTELLLAFEKMEQDEQLMQEELRDLESRSLLTGFNLYDQYWDMRMDIDDMSYEELLALGDEIGTVSTALSEEQLLKCIERGKYQKTSSQVTRGSEEGAEIKCSICQEEYVVGDDIGRLSGCQHEYHATCINHWLMLKNWCPICKSTAAQLLSS